MTITTMRVPYNYLTEEFAIQGLYPGKTTLAAEIFAELMLEVPKGEFTLGPAVAEFESMWAETVGTKYAIGVNSGTDALFLSLKALGIGEGDWVATVPNTFMATVGAILATGARPYFVDIGDDYLMQYPTMIDMIDGEYYIKAVIPVHWGGAVSPIRNGKHGGSAVLEDAAQAIGGIADNGMKAGTLGKLAAFALHRLKNVNVWGDGGMITTSDEGLAQELRLLRNHGLEGRDNWVKPGYNSRLHTIQAIVGKHVLSKEFEWATKKRIDNARQYDEGLSIPGVIIPPRTSQRHVYHLYQFEVENRSVRQTLLQHLINAGIEAKVHYPIPLHLQPALAHLGYKRGDFPRTERFCDTHITLPVHQYLTDEQVDYVIEVIRDFFKRA